MPSVTVQKAVKRTEMLPALREVENLADAIQQRAYQLFEQRGQRHGCDLDDWLEAQRQILGSPTAEFSSEETCFLVRVALPGFTARQVIVIAGNDEVIVRAETDQPANSGEFNLKAMCHFRFPESIDLARLSATMEKGCVLVTAPKLREQVDAAHS
jgi:HSP20 family molecular chaperone IbpA